MPKKSMKEIARVMKGLDLCMLTTSIGSGQSVSRPMSNNGKVDYNGDSCYFTWTKSKMAREIAKNPRVSLQFQSAKILKKLFIAVSGKASLTSDRAEMERNWSKDLEIWFEDGLDTPGIVMIKVKAEHIKYWNGSDEGEWEKKT